MRIPVENFQFSSRNKSICKSLPDLYVRPILVLISIGSDIRTNRPFGRVFASLVTEYSKSLVRIFARLSYSGFNLYLTELLFCVMIIYGGFISDKTFRYCAQEHFFAWTSHSYLPVFCGPVGIPFIQIGVRKCVHASFNVAPIRLNERLAHVKHVLGWFPPDWMVIVGTNWGRIVIDDKLVFQIVTEISVYSYPFLEFLFEFTFEKQFYKTYFSLGGNIIKNGRYQSSFFDVRCSAEHVQNLVQHDCFCNYSQSRSYTGQLLEHLLQFLKQSSILFFIQTSAIDSVEFKRSIASFS